MTKKKSQENIEIVNLHQKHRKRMDERYRRSGFDGWSEYEILEYMLYATIARGDTSPQAHELLRIFGTLENVLEADVDELAKVDGIGHASARHLSSLYHLNKYLNEKDIIVPRKFNLDTEKTVQYIRQQFSGDTSEVFIMICLDAKNKLIKTEALAHGTFNHADIDVTTVTRAAVRCKAAKVIFAHNHPSGNAVPSESDIHTTDWLTTALTACGVVVLEHVIIAGDKVGLVKKYQKTGIPHPEPTQTVQMKSYNKTQ